MSDRVTRRAALPSDRASRFERWRTRLADTPETLAADAQVGLEGDDFYLLYQPRVSTSDGEVRAVEALLRWNGGERGAMKPGSFLPTLADTSVMGPLGRWVLAEACVQAEEWEATRHPESPPVAIAVNLTIAELQDPARRHEVREAVTSGPVPPPIEVEVDLDHALTIDPAVGRFLDDLRRDGVPVALDGVAPTLVTEELPLPCDWLNLGRRLVRVVDADPACAELVGGLVRWAEERSVAVTAIGVERQEQADILTDLGCARLQGYLYSEPVPGTELGWVEGPPTAGPSTARSKGRGPAGG